MKSQKKKMKFDKTSIIEKICIIDEKLCSPEVLKIPPRIRYLTEERSELAKILSTIEAIELTRDSIKEMHLYLNDDDEELADIAREDLPALEAELEKLYKKLKILLIPPDPNDKRDVIIEIRSGTGGDEAALFAGEIFEMYLSYASKKGWQTEVFDSRDSGRGGFKEVIFAVRGRGVYSRMKFEAGVHRVQRVPETETSGRLHTSACTVAILPEAEEVEITIDPEDLRVDVYRSSGPGGQSVNTTDSAVRITHVPTGTVVSCQDEKSQHKNKAKALKVLRSRLFALKQAEEKAKRAEKRKSMVGSGDRSAKIRTYNYPQNRITDHRIKLTLHSLKEVLGGDLEQVITPLIEAEQERLLAEVTGDN